MASFSSQPPLAYSDAELDRAEKIYELKFPPDLRRLLIRGTPLLNYDWRTDTAAIRNMLRWPYDGLLFDVEHNSLWLKAWGNKPRGLAAQAEKLAELVAAAPKLIPLHGHRYLPASPCEDGNPVFSVYQSDIVYYGADLSDYLQREAYGGTDRKWPDAIKRIPFWTDLIDHNN